MIDETLTVFKVVIMSVFSSDVLEEVPSPSVIPSETIDNVSVIIDIGEICR